ncbi:membrane protein insertion efficiency factor YidD [Hydrogenophaga sp. 5NK40-0174]|uniref:membrane protein insertion efficiency factor YidD n=1 Tax=Hydrogenophaga sp. 5NK40-0174 TaxID=3127649 RepID=UPI00310ACDB6
MWREWPRNALIGLVKAYRLVLSPWLGNSCRFEPTCSVYAIGALERHGAVRGTYLAAARIVRCQPWCKGGHDPVPESASSTAGLFSRWTRDASAVSGGPVSSSHPSSISEQGKLPS